MNRNILYLQTRIFEVLLIFTVILDFMATKLEHKSIIYCILMSSIYLFVLMALEFLIWQDKNAKR